MKPNNPPNFFKLIGHWIKTLFLIPLSRNSFLWKYLGNYIVKAGQFIQHEHDLKETKNQRVLIYEAIKQISPNRVVKTGIFKGMKLPEYESLHSSMLIPKILGSYEYELRSVLQRVSNENYRAILNIGCGEGYYAVGLARCFPQARVLAYDIDSNALRLCQEMAQLNGVASRVSTHSVCTAKIFEQLSPKVRALIICDCEGYEKELFIPESLPFLTGHDLLIEIHDCFDIQISSLLQNLFKNTHDIEIIESIDDALKVKKYSNEDFYKDIQDYDLSIRMQMLTEKRGSIMEWFYLRSKQPIK